MILLRTAAAVIFATAITMSQASAAEPQTVAPSGAVASTSHYEWQYHYVGHHPRYEGHWILVR